jgi:branched-chain amino acid transport system permease protein
MTMFFAYLASSWNVLGGYCGHFALGNGVFIGIGAYVTGLLFKQDHISPYIGMIIAALFSGVLSLIMSYPCFKLRGSYYVLSTVALLYVFRIIILNEPVLFGYQAGASMGLRIPWRGGAFDMQFYSKIPYYYIIMFLLFVAIAISIYLSNSKTGYYFSSIVTNQEAAESLGVNTTLYKLIAQFISASLTAIGGGFYVMFIMFLDPNRVLSYGFSIEIMLYAVMGGMGTVWGPVMGAMVLYPMNEMLRTTLGTTFAGLSPAIYGLILMLIVYYMPKGVLPWISTLYQRQKLKSHRIAS